MKTRLQLQIILLLIVENFAKEAETIQNTEGVMESTTNNIDLTSIGNVGQEKKLQSNSGITLDSGVVNVKLEPIQNIYEDTELQQNDAILAENSTHNVEETSIKNVGQDTEISNNSIIAEESITEGSKLESIINSGQETELQQSGEIMSESTARNTGLTLIKNVGQEAEIVNNGVTAEESVTENASESTTRSSKLEPIINIIQETSLQKSDKITTGTTEMNVILMLIEKVVQEAEVLNNSVAVEKSVGESATRTNGLQTELQQNNEITAKSTATNVGLTSMKNVIQGAKTDHKIIRAEESVTESTTQTSRLALMINLRQETENAKNNEIIEENITESVIRNIGLESTTTLGTTEVEAIKMVAIDNSAITKEPKSTKTDVESKNITKIIETEIVKDVSTETYWPENTINREILENEKDSEEKSTTISNEKIKISFKDIEPITIEQDEIMENSLKFSETFSTTVKSVLGTKPSISLEDYAVKHMNFILDHLLMETQEFVAKVLQATVYTVFQRDYLKRYAESLNRLLNPDNDSDYSDDIIEDSKNITQDELYEEILLKLSFLRSRSSKSLQKHLPQDWVIEYRSKRAELAIWLDKAAEQMHQEFKHYITEAEDHIKYQYFNEAFDDISRANEIHHKLALLMDLVKIVKNKKQITFMDLYMQT